MHKVMYLTMDAMLKKEYLLQRMVLGLLAYILMLRR